jgi:hypothetical protein
LDKNLHRERENFHSLTLSNYPYSCQLIIVVETGVHIAFRQVVVKKKKKADHHHYHRVKLKKKKRRTREDNLLPNY